MISANDGTAIPTAAQHAERMTETIRLAYEIADDAAAMQLRSYCVLSERAWLSTAPHPGQTLDDGAVIAKALRYLRLRDLLEFDPDEPHLVKVRAE